MDKYALQEHASQINEATAAYIETQAMIAENMIRESNGLSLAYDGNAFDEIQRKYHLTDVDIEEKKRKF